ncbi:LOW QUALITY PROTEIN: UDP-glycosyltransferase 90A1-like [Macadamia integrifolia]|uniref:LOW QUALITY PROTEIN: UDP-glycosyltransferase 90A1-like n=1 Tax=Macadamia integrifolia TaxID=60698 RepID=UPI001C52D51B|nr:LOW QUALITY PROTEIN: UDP-glycosyltransferase 90A1-like [Macadamia integrifolia]
MSSNSSLHIVIFPFMSKGHTIPMLHLTRLLLLRRGITITIVTTQANSPFIRQSLYDTQPPVNVIELAFPANIPQLPPGVESTDRLPSMSLFVPLANATKLMQPDFERVLKSLSASGGISFIISDGFFGWTQQSAEKFGIPRLVFSGMNNYTMTICGVLAGDRSHLRLGPDEPFTVPGFPWVNLTMNDFDPTFNDPELKGPHMEFIMEVATATSKSQGIVVNSFYELEPTYLDYWNREFVPKAWCVGPLCLAEPPKVDRDQKPEWIKWLDQKSAEGRSVLYVAFGSQAEISPEQLREMADGLEQSEVCFLWVVRSKVEGLEERVKERGLVVREWVDQVEILRHESVNGFMSHCGWNSAMESICASVPILAWPMMAEQPFNARMVAEELGVGLRIVASNGSVRGFVSSEIVEKMVRELMEGEEGKKARRKVKDIGKAARKAMEGGSSWRTLDQLIDETCRKKDP